jgi:uncharacterized membrane protein YeaQ/YmgE (transglycosylase-associated protein family)
MLVEKYQIFLIWLIIGIVIALIIQAVDTGKVKGGLFSTTLASLIGAIAGGIIANMYFKLDPLNSNINSLLVSGGGSLLASALYRLIMRDNSHIKTQTLQVK